MKYEHYLFQCIRLVIAGLCGVVTFCKLVNSFGRPHWFSTQCICKAWRLAELMVRWIVRYDHEISDDVC